MANRLFQSVIHQMKDAVSRVIGVIDENGVIIACSDVKRVGEPIPGVKEELAFSAASRQQNGYTYRFLTTTAGKSDVTVFVEGEDKKADELLRQAYEQMAPLNDLFTDEDALNLIHDTIPMLSFDSCFSAEKEEDMKVNYDFDLSDEEQSTIDVLAGDYNENPFLFENRVIHRMGEETYHGYETIHWTETYRDSSGKLCTRTIFKRCFSS